MPRTNFKSAAIAIVAALFSLASCMEKIGDEMSESMTFVRGDYRLTPKVEIEVETIKEIIHDTLYYKVVVMDSIFIHDTLPPRYIYDTVKVEVPVPYPVHDTVIVVQRDTVWQTIIEEKTDTLYLRDTIDKSFSGMLRGKCYVAGRKKAAVQRYTFDKGEIVNQEVLYGSFKLSLTAGKTEVKNKAHLNSIIPKIYDNTFSFDVTDGVGGASVSNTWGYEYNAVAQFDGFTESLDAELSIESADFYQRSDLEWRHMVTASLDGIPQATATWEFWKEEEVVPEPEIIRDTTYSQAVPVSASQAKVVRTITANGTQESSKDILVNYSASLECGEKEMISNMSLLDYGKAVAAKDGANTVAMNIHSFNATVDVPSKLTFSDEGKQISVDFNYTNLAIESNGAITRTDNSTDAYDLINNTAYFKLVLNGFTVATDNKEIEQKKEHEWGWEWDKEAEFSSDMKTVYLTGYRTKNNIRTGFSFQCSANLEYTFTPGAALEFNSNETPSIKDANAVIIGNEAFIPHILGSTEFNANFTYGGTTRVTFSYSDEYVSDEVTVDLNISYDVKAIGAIEKNGSSYSTPAALYANGVEVKNEKFVFSVIPVQPTYTGYRVYNAGQWAITRIYDQNAATSLVVLVGTLEHLQTGDIYAIHQVLEGSAGNLPENFQKISTPSFGEPYSMYYNVAASSWNYGSIIGAKKGTTNTSWMYFNWNRTDNQIVSSNTSTDLLDDVVLYQLGSEDNISSEAGTISLTYNGQTITVVSDK